MCRLSSCLKIILEVHAPNASPSVLPSVTFIHASCKPAQHTRKVFVLRGRNVSTLNIVSVHVFEKRAPAPQAERRKARTLQRQLVHFGTRPVPSCRVAIELGLLALRKLRKAKACSLV